jgi:nicotinamide phosphoribosyltransferase
LLFEVLTMNNSNILLDIDSYKSSHFLQYPPGTTGMFSYLESRGGEFQETVFFGLQYILKEYLSKPITMEMVDEAAVFLHAHGVPFNADGWRRVVTAHGGKLPIRIRAVPEGTVVPTHNALMTVESTDPECFWVVSWLETQLMRIWYPITVATLSRKAKEIIKWFLDDTSDNVAAELPWKLHDFGSRGVSSAESAGIGGAAHLVNFRGSDTINGILLANKYYGCDMAGFSIPAAEHSSITSWGRDHEVDAYRNMLKQFAKPGAVLAVVSDSYDIYNAVENIWGGVLKQEVIDSGATVVIRPDSGDPVTVVMGVLERLADKFGTTVNSKGYHVLNHVRVIQGDGVDYFRIQAILGAMREHKWAASNLAFGMGGALLQKVNRDTLKFAFKCSSISLSSGEQRDVFKQPVTDAGKVSKAGRLDYTRSGKTVIIPPGLDVHPDSALVEVFRDGKILSESSFDMIRMRAEVK